jgi:transcriptional regulator with XRE-family HTH domain
MTYPPYIKEHARRLRTEKRLSLDEIAERLALPKTTVWYWISDLPLGREARWSEAQRKAYQATSAKYRALGEKAYEQGAAEWDELVTEPTFRDFVALYIAEGYKRSRNHVRIANSDERIVAMATSWLRRLSGHEPVFCIQYHADQDLDELRRYWGQVLRIDGGVIRLQRKSNSSQLSGRTWRSAHGVVSVNLNDTQLRARLQAWIDRIRSEWA